MSGKHAESGTAFNTAVDYLYRDADNYKQYERVVFEGRITDEERKAISAALIEGCHFIPSDVGLENLQGRMTGGWREEVDHPWHELEEIVLTTAPATLSGGIHAFADTRADASRVSTSQP